MSEDTKLPSLDSAHVLPQIVTRVIRHALDMLCHYVDGFIYLQYVSINDPGISIVRGNAQCPLVLVRIF